MKGGIAVTLRIIAGFVAIACVSICGFLATFANSRMIEQVNARLPEGERFELIGWYWPKYQSLRHEYKKFYPEGRLLIRVRILGVIMLVGLVVAAWCFGVVPR